MTSQNHVVKSLMVLIACLAVSSTTLVQASPRGESVQFAQYAASELQTLRDEVASLRRQVRLLRAHGGAADPESKQAKKRGPGSGAGDAQVELAPDRDEATQRKQRAVAIGKQFKAEKVDAKWAHVANYRVRAALDATALRRVPEQGIACRASLCRLEVKADNAAQASTLGRDLVMRLAREFPRGHMHRDNSDPDKPSLVFYLVRAGHRLPKPSK